MPVIGRCKKCNKRVVYYVDNGETEIKDIPQRNCSSGVTYM
nr:MAG TPA: cysteine-rich protein [Bacteriophage sp.]DAW30546.1 MAG TPA: cysteine-rich protein [Bacteriophage sp.]